MTHITIIGNGVGARIMAYTAVMRDIGVTVIAPSASSFAPIAPGAKYIVLDHDMPPMMADAINSTGGINVGGLSGGVTRVSSDGVHRLYTWEEIVSDRALAIRLSYDYAKATGRRWDRKTLFSIIDMKEVPKVSYHPSYSGLMDVLSDAVYGKVEFVDSNIVSISDGRITTSEGRVFPYSNICSTAPLWVSGFLPVSVPDVRRSSARFALVTPSDQHNRSSLEYFIPEEGSYWHIKRISTDSISRVIEYFDIPYADRSRFSALPPNITSIPDTESARLDAELKPYNIYLLGRYAQAKSKIGLQDMFRRAAYITDNILG